VLLKLYPSAYKRRVLEIAELEKKTGSFSPQFEFHLSQSHSSKELGVSCSSSQSQLSLPSSMGEGEPSSSVKDSSAAISADKTSTNTLPNLSCEARESMGLAENSLPENISVLRSCEQVHIADVLCGLCKELLYKPLVLNCGHVYCESCIINPSNMINCQACQCVQPNGFPKVCLVLDHFLEDRFSIEYTARRSAVLNLAGSQCGNSTKRSTEDQEPDAEHSRFKQLRLGKKVHVGFGCDHCGLCPITGKRYHCNDCIESPGFDLCELCYDNRSSNRPGRFNLQHKLEHELKLVDTASTSLDILGDVLNRDDLTHDMLPSRILENSNPPWIASRLHLEAIHSSFSALRRDLLLISTDVAQNVDEFTTLTPASGPHHSESGMEDYYSLTTSMDEVD
jgi:hypothetical protein